MGSTLVSLYTDISHRGFGAFKTEQTKSVLLNRRKTFSLLILTLVNYLEKYLQKDRG